MKKRVVVALGHRALGTTLPEQKEAVKKTAKVIGDLIEKGYQVAVTHSNAPQVGMIHTAMNEFAKEHEDYTAAPMSVCSAMSQGYIGYDLQNAIRFRCSIDPMSFSGRSMDNISVSSVVPPVGIPLFRSF